MVPGLAMVAAAALAGWSWRSVLHGGGPFRRQEAALLAGWAGLSAVARIVDLRPGVWSGVGADVLLVVASALGLVAVAGVVRRITGAYGGSGAAVAEAALSATSLVTFGWVLAGGPLRPPSTALVGLAPALVDLATLSLVVRLVMLVPDVVRQASHRRRLVVCAGAAGLVCAGDALQGLAGLGLRVPAWAVGAVLATGYLLAALVPRIRALPPAVPGPAAGLRVLPYALVTTAIFAVCAQALLSRTGPVPVVLVTLVVTSLVLLQACTLNENHQLVDDLTESRQRLTALVENTSDLIVRLDGNGRVMAANAAAVRLLHRTPRSLSGRSFDDLARAEDRRLVREAVLDVTRGRRESAQVELRLAAPATGTAQLRLRAVPGGAVANLNDVTDAVELRQRLERLARYDQMTGLVNRAHLLEVVGSWLAEPDADVVVLYADLDGFKGVNDRFGHGAGDRVLIEVASRLEALAGAVDARRVLVGRVGGDEFIVGLEGIAAAAARVAAQRVVEAVAPPFAIGDRTVQLGVSVGVAGSGPAHGHRVRGVEEGAAELVHRADLAMYAAKAGGRARVEGWVPELEERARRRVDIAIGLRGALGTGRLAVAYQPIVRLADGVVIGAEALLRVPPGVGPAGLVPGLDELVSPAELVAVAEDNGTILEMGEWVLDQAVQQAAQWARKGHQAGVSVNMSVQQLVSPHFVASVQAVLDAYHLPPARLVLELTESQLVGQAGPALQALAQLRAAGVRLAIDDFGTGYSSLSYLRRLPVQLVKIDRTLLADVRTDPRSRALVRSVVAMAADLDLLVVAEGMEDMASVRLLRDFGTYAGQGFALSPALPPDRMAQVLAGPALDLDAGSGGPGSAAPDLDRRAALAAVDLADVNRVDADLDADLEDAALDDADPEGADLGDADPDDADPGNADLGDANLEDSSLGDADPDDADPGNADPENADPQEATDADRAEPSTGAPARTGRVACPPSDAPRTVDVDAAVIEERSSRIR